jgi:MFS family permease
MDFNTSSGRGAGFALLVLGRFIVGLGSGAATVIVPMFLTELASRSYRGMFGALNQMTLVVAILIAQVRRALSQKHCRR